MHQQGNRKTQAFTSGDPPRHPNATGATDRFAIRISPDIILKLGNCRSFLDI
jgi:hypothetical protein